MAGTLSLLMKLSSNPRICIVLLSAVGDVTHALPIVNAIKRHRPQSHITWLLQEAGAALIQGHPAVDEILLFQRKAGLAGFVKMAMELADRPFDVVLDLQCYFKATLLTALCRAPVKIDSIQVAPASSTGSSITTIFPNGPSITSKSTFLNFSTIWKFPANQSSGI